MIHLRSADKDICQRDLKFIGLDPTSTVWEKKCHNRTEWRSAIKNGVTAYETLRRQQAHTLKDMRKARTASRSGGISISTDFICHICQKDCHANIGLASHLRFKHSSWPSFTMFLPCCCFLLSFFFYSCVKNYSLFKLKIRQYIYVHESSECTPFSEIITRNSSPYAR